MPDVTLDDIRSDFGLYYLAIHPTYGNTYFQQNLMAPVFDRIVDDDPDYGHVANCMPFGHSKSDMGTVAFATYYLGHHPDRNVMVICYGDVLSRDFGRQMRSIMQEPLYQELFPRATLSTRSFAVDHFQTVTGGNYFGCSIDGVINGRRVHLLIMDDLIKSPEAARSDADIRRWRATYSTVIIGRMEPVHTQLINMTRWTPTDPVGWRVEKDGGWDHIFNRPYRDGEKPASVVEPTEFKRGMWRIVRLRAWATEDEGWRSAHCECGLTTEAGAPVPHGEPLWPEKWPCAKLYPKYLEDPAFWEANYQQEPTLGGGYWFAMTPPNFYEQVRQEEFNIYMLCDPALAKHRKADYTTIMVIGLGADQNYYWLELCRARMNMKERTAHIFRLHRKWRPISLGYEEYGLQCDTATIADEMEKQNYRFKMVALGRAGIWHNLTKGDRISNLIPLAVNGRIFIPNPDTKGRDREEIDTIKYFIEKEWNTYPSSKHDDVLDVMSRIKDPTLAAEFPVAAPASRYIKRPWNSQRTWMSR